MDLGITRATMHEEGLLKKASSIGLSQDRLKELLEYNPETGIFTRLVTANGNALAGSEAGSIDAYGYVIISIGGYRFKAHHLAWFYVHGEWRMIDHKEWPRSNNAISNLRPASYSQNNHRKHTYNPLGHIGVRLRNGKYQANIRINGVITTIGNYDTVGEAGEAYKQRAREVFGEYANEGE